MKKTRRVHLWIGLIASIFIFLESLTGLIMNEPWLIGQQTQIEGGVGNFQPGQFNREQMNQGQTGQGVAPDSGQTSGQANGQTNGQTNGQAGTENNGRFQGRGGFGGNGNFAGFRGGEMGQGSFLSTIRGLHEGRIGNTDIKWLIDLVAVAMMALTGTGIYLSIQILRADRKRKKHQAEEMDAFVK